jgi:hypothetical protein
VPEHDAGQDGEQERGRRQRRPEAGPAQLRDPLFQHFVDDLSHPVIEHVAEPVEELVGRQGGVGRHRLYHKTAKERLQANFCRKISVKVLRSRHGDDAASGDG